MAKKSLSDSTTEPGNANPTFLRYPNSVLIKGNWMGQVIGIEFEIKGAKPAEIIDLVRTILIKKPTISSSIAQRLSETHPTK